MIYKVKLFQQNVIFMSGNENCTFSIIHVNTEKFCSIWDDIQKNDKSCLDWYVKKYMIAEKCFLNSHNHPVPLPIIGGFQVYGGNRRSIRLTDGITRIQWLVDHDAKSFPIYCPLALKNELEVVVAADANI